MSDSFYFHLKRRSVPTSNSKGRPIYWTPVEGSGGIRETNAEGAEDARKSHLFQTGMVTELDKAGYEDLKKKVVKLSSDWLQPQFGAPPTASAPSSTPPPPLEKPAAAGSNVSDGRKRRSKPATSVGALEQA